MIAPTQRKLVYALAETDACRPSADQLAAAKHRGGGCSDELAERSARITIALSMVESANRLNGFFPNLS